jgi:hypothetical protein
MIFFGGVRPAQVVEAQWIAILKNTKNWKNACENVKYFRGNPCFSAIDRLIY